jgi:hypothetical protein
VFCLEVYRRLLLHLDAGQIRAGFRYPRHSSGLQKYMCIHTMIVLFVNQCCCALMLADTQAAISGFVSLFLSYAVFCVTYAQSPVSHIHVFCITAGGTLYGNIPSGTNEQSHPESRLTLYHK